MNLIADLTALLSIIGLVVDLIGAFTLIGHSINSIRKIGFVIQSWLHKVGYGGKYDFQGLDDGLRRLSEKGTVRPTDDGFSDLARFIAVVSGGYWGRSGIFAGGPTYHARPVSALEKEKITLSNDREYVNLEVHDPSTPAVDIDPLRIERERLYEYANTYAEKRFLLAGAILISVGFALQIMAETIDAFGPFIGGIFGTIVFVILAVLFGNARL